MAIAQAQHQEQQTPGQGQVCRVCGLLLQGADDLGLQQEAPVFPDLAPLGADQAGQESVCATGDASLAAQLHDRSVELLAALRAEKEGG